MTRPQIIRADTIDLQDQNAPSAKDHTRQPTNPAALGEGPPAPHQAIALKNAGLDGLEHPSRSPRASTDLSGKELQLLHEHPDPEDGANGDHDGRNGDHGGNSEEDMEDAEGDDGLDDDMMDRISSSPSIDNEDIDFEFVYALHTFVATVEGQANATKGDTMVLLDDSNSYWWLVRVVKDSSIGYLPAEHIETPTERLARLNKHRNIDLSQTMLGDNPEKSRNPLKKAMRRRNAKTVQFTEPTYYEPSENEYSSDEEGEDGELHDGAEAAQAQAQVEQQTEDDANVVEPLNVRGPKKENAGNDEITTEPNVQQADTTQDTQSEKRQTSEEISDRSEDGLSNGKLRNGVVRNTDSFFKDDSIETRKINLTPSLLRDDSNASAPSEVKETKGRGSLDAIDKAASSADKLKDDKRKEKKSGMLSGLFKRKDRKSKTQGDDDDPDWLSKEIAAQASQPKVSSESLEGVSAPTSPQKGLPTRQSSKLQKNPPPKLSPALKRSPSSDGQNPLKSNTDQPSGPPPDRAAPGAPEQNPFEDKEYESDIPAKQAPPLRINTPTHTNELSNGPTSPTDSKARSLISPIRDVLRSPTEPKPEKPKPEKLKKAKIRMVIDDSDSSGSEYPPTPALAPGPQQQSVQQQRGQEPQQQPISHNQPRDRLSESPIQVSPVVLPSNPPALDDSPSSQDDAASPSSSPELIDLPEESSGTHRDATTPSSTVQSGRIAPEWSSAHLRTYLENDTDIRDLLVVVHDTSDVKPAGPEHPIVKGFEPDHQRLHDIEGRLDGMLKDLLARKAPGRK